MLGLFALAGCGFTPVYGDAGRLHGSIAFTTPETVAGYRLGERLEERLGVANAPRYTLRVTLTQSRASSAITEDGNTTRFKIVGSGNWVLRDNATGDEIDKGIVNAFTSYSTTASTTATQSAETDAVARLSVILADMIVARLLILGPKIAQ